MSISVANTYAPILIYHVMNTRQFEEYFKDSWDSITSTLHGYKYRDIELAGDSAAQLAINQLQTEAQQKESELAYRRSSAPNQVSQMMAAGMSRAGAINALNGGGSYTPAPISLGTPNVGSAASNVSQKNLDIASTALNGISSLASNVQQFQQMKNQQKQFNESLDLQREQIQKDAELKREQMQSNERIAQLQADTTNRNADNRLNWEKRQFEVLSPYQIRQIEANIAKVNSDVQLTQVQTEDLQYKYAEYVENRSVRDAVALFQELESVYKLHVTEQDFIDFKRSYMYYDEETDSYQYTQHTKALTKVESAMTQFWDVVAKILPANKLGKIINFALGK